MSDTERLEAALVERSTACASGDHWACFIGCMCPCHAAVADAVLGVPASPKEAD